MRLEKVRNCLDEKGFDYDFAEEDGVGSIDFIDRGLSYHIWEFQDDDGTYGAETNLFHAGHMEEVNGDYEEEIVELLAIFKDREGM